MPLLRTGRDTIAGLLVTTLSSGQRAYRSPGAVLYICTSTEAHVATSTWFGAAACLATMESGYPSLAACSILQFRGVYSTAAAHGQIESWGIHGATVSSTGYLLNMAVQQVLGTKTSAQSWQITTCILITT